MSGDSVGASSGHVAGASGVRVLAAVSGDSFSVMNVGLSTAGGNWLSNKSVKL